MLKNNSKVKIVWKGYYHEMSKAKENDIKESFAKKYNLQKNQIEIERVYLKTKTEGDERVSTAILDSVLDPKKLKKAYKSYLKEYFPQVNVEEFLKLDKEISEKIEDIKDFNSIKDRKYKFLWIKANNIFSYENFYRDYTDKNGIIAIYSSPGNQGGKTALSRMPSFLLFGNKIKYGRKTSITFPDVFNKYTTSNIASIEGEIKIQNDVYYLKRTLKKGKTGNISHSFSIYKYDDEGDYIEFLGRNAIDLSIKDAQKTRKKFEDVIGSYEDYIFSSYYESQNIEKWLETTETERYRLFCEYLGLGILEQKNKIASKELTTFLKSSLMTKYSLEELNNEIDSAKVQIFNIDNEIDLFSNENIKFQKELSKLNDRIISISSTRKNIDGRISNIEINKLFQSHIETEKLIFDISEGILKLKDSISNTEAIYKDNSNKIKIEESIVAIRKQINNVDQEIPKELISELSKKRNDSYNIIEPSDLTSNKENIEGRLNDTKVKYNVLNSNINTLKEELENVPISYICPKCGNIESGEKKKEETLKKIEQAEISLNEVIQEGKSLRKKLELIQKRIEDYKKNEKNKVAKEIQEIESKISAFRREYLSKNNEEINKLNSELKKFTEYSNLLRDLEKEEQNLVINTKIFDEQKELIELYNSSKDIIDFNNNIDFEIKQIQNDINDINSKIQINNNNINNGEKTKGSLEYQIKINTQNINEIKSDYKYEKLLKTYIAVHSDEGLSKHIILSILPQINSDLAEVLNGITDFDLSIDFDNKGIRFIFERDGQKFQLYQGSGFEKTISCLALHYVNIKMTTLPISNNLILDEIFGGFSKENMESIKRILRRLGEIFDTIDVITHTLKGEVINTSDHTIEIRKEDNISKILD